MHPLGERYLEQIIKKDSELAPYIGLHEQINFERNIVNSAINYRRVYAINILEIEIRCDHTILEYQNIEKAQSVNRPKRNQNGYHKK